MYRCFDFINQFPKYVVGQAVAEGQVIFCNRLIPLSVYQGLNLASLSTQTPEEKKERKAELWFQKIGDIDRWEKEHIVWETSAADLYSKNPNNYAGSGILFYPDPGGKKAEIKPETEEKTGQEEQT